MTDIEKEDASIAPGDIVQLKSYGPPMTVVSLDNDGVNAVWYDEVTGDVKTRFLPLIALEKIFIVDEDDEDDDEDEDERARKPRGKKKHR